MNRSPASRRSSPARSRSNRSRSRSPVRSSTPQSNNIDPITLERYPRSREVIINRQRYDARSLHRWLQGANVVPHSRRRVTNEERALIALKAGHRPANTNYTSILQQTVLDPSLENELLAIQALDRGADVNTRVRYARSSTRPFFVAVFSVPSRYSIQLIEKLIEKGADINFNGGMLLLHAASSGERLVPLVSRLLELGANTTVTVTGSDPYTTPVLHVAGTHDMARFLIRKFPAMVNARDDLGRTPLHLANAITAKLLLAAGANVNARDEQGRTPIYYARSANDIKRLARAGADLNTTDADGITPLMHKVNHGIRQSDVKALVSSGADVNKRDAAGRTALLWYIDTPSAKPLPVQLLLNAGADVNMAANDGRTPLMVAVSKGYRAIAQKLLLAGADPNRVNRDGTTALMLAVTQGPSATPLVKMLVEAGARIDLRNRSGKSAANYITMRRNRVENAATRGEKAALTTLKKLLDTMSQRQNQNRQQQQRRRALNNELARMNTNGRRRSTSLMRSRSM